MDTLTDRQVGRVVEIGNAWLTALREFVGPKLYDSLMNKQKIPRRVLSLSRLKETQLEQLNELFNAVGRFQDTFLHEPVRCLIESRNAEIAETFGEMGERLLELMARYDMEQACDADFKMRMQRIATNLKRLKGD